MVGEVGPSLVSSPKGVGSHGPPTAPSLEEQRSLTSSWRLASHLPGRARHLT